MANATTVHLSEPLQHPSSITPTALTSITSMLPFPEAYATKDSHSQHQCSTTTSKHNNNTRPPPSTTTIKTNKCILCNNQHPNP
jgi:hypothetical protein